MATITGTSGNDNLSGTSGGDVFLPGAGTNYMLGKAGNDAFVVRLADLESGAKNTIYDFGGAGGYTAGNNDFLALTGFSAGGSLVGVQDSSVVANLAYYTFHDNASGHDFIIAITSTNGKHLAAGDFNFY
uniref:Hemolysin-type calcium-binding region n=1 Tax=Caulobacter sp. (strain K31) TaxID=366602 RepID=B0SXN1_CAUSK